ncbi:MAG: phosphoribosylformylglycinamidine cyclo-ligase [Oligoflexia bacterium]|nr:phosphoribosylformylglycinamidine cyclo-ligase [Oligoflexia bacterium]
MEIKNETLSYAQAGVDRAAADRFVGRIAMLARSTLNKKVKGAVGGYASLYELDKKRWLAASTDGVGTKLKLAFMLGEHSTVGIDLVAMSVNDLLCVGAEPLFFLDYLATGKLEPGIAERILAGIVEGCKQARCALVGGETAQMPDFYRDGEYDLGGFAVGQLAPKDALPRKDVKPGDVLLGISSSGAHSNGYSLLRKLLENEPDFEIRARELLTPTRIYAKSLGPLIAARAFKGLAHITGSGFLNVPRISSKVSYEINLPSADERPRIFDWIRDRSGLPLEELAQTFNLGIGMIAVVEPRKAGDVLKKLKRAGETAWIVGEVTRKRRGATDSEVTLRENGRSVVIS